MILLGVASFPISCSPHKHTTTFQGEIEINESKIFHQPEEQAHYIRGGKKGLLHDLYTTILKSAPVTQDSVTGRAYVQFKITKHGIIDPNSIKVIRNRYVPDDYMNTAIEAIKSLGNFEPGKMMGTPVTVTYLLPIIYPVPTDHIKTSE